MDLRATGYGGDLLYKGRPAARLGAWAVTARGLLWTGQAAVLWADDYWLAVGAAFTLRLAVRGGAWELDAAVERTADGLRLWGEGQPRAGDERRE